MAVQSVHCAKGTEPNAEEPKARPVKRRILFYNLSTCL